MAVGLVLQIAGMSRREYDAVSAQLNIDQQTGKGDWPPGLLSHAAGAADDGSWVVIETWESRDAQGRFMQERLGSALQAGGVSATPQITWVDLVANHRLGAA